MSSDYTSDSPTEAQDLRPPQPSTGNEPRASIDVTQKITTVKKGGSVIGVQYGYSPKEIAALLASAARNGADLSALHQLAEPPECFRDRATEMAALLQQADGSPSVIGVQGAGGVGKTALALKLAHALTQHYPDAQFFIDMHGTDNQPLAPADALLRLLRAYVPSIQMPGNIGELRALYASLLYGKRTLSLLTNVRNAEQVNQLLPPAGSLLILTSQQHFYIAGMVVQELDTLGAKEACELLLAIAPRIGEQAEPIAEVCGYLPLALTLAATWVREHRTLSPADYLRRCQDAQALLKLTGADTALRVSYELLDATNQALWRALAVFPHGFDAAGASAVWNCDPVPGADRLDELQANSMVEWNSAANRFHLHNLARVFARAQANAAEFSQAESRHAVYYEQVLRNAEQLYRHGSESVQPGLALFDREWSNIQAAHAWGEAHVADDSTAVRLCSTFPQAARLLLDLRLPLSTLIQWLNTGLTAAQTLGERETEAKHLNDLAVAYSDLGEANRSNAYAEQALDIARQIGNRYEEGCALSYLGSNYTDLGEAQRAIASIEQALQIDRELHDQSGESSDQRYMGDALARLGQAQEALTWYQQALAIARQLGDEEDIARNLSSLASAYVAIGDPAQAVRFCHDAIEIEQAIGDRFNEGRNCDTLGLAYAAQGDFQRAVTYHQRAAGLARANEDRHGESLALLHLGTAQAHIKQEA